MRIIVCRNDKLGDFMLAWPTFALLKQHWPEARLTALVPAYTAPIANLCPWIDSLLIDDEAKSTVSLARRLRAERFDAMLTLFSSGRVGLAGWLARIPYRLAPATKAVQLLYNHRLTQRRSRSEKPEYAYNLDLGYRLLADLDRLEGEQQTREENGDWLPARIQRPLLSFTDDVASLKKAFCLGHGLPTHARLVFIHPGSGGSANNLQPEQYSRLANLLTSTAPLAFVITAGPGEMITAKQVAAGVAAPVTVYESSGLEAFARTLQLADLFISGSTGPLHIAAALNCSTAAFYPRHRSATPLRWQTTNSPEKRLAFTPPEQSDERDVQQIDVADAAERISGQLLG